MTQEQSRDCIVAYTARYGPFELAEDKLRWIEDFELWTVSWLDCLHSVKQDGGK